MGYQNGTAKTGGLPADAVGSASQEHKVLFTLQPNPAQTTVALNWLNFKPNATSEVTIYNGQGVVVSRIENLENSTLKIEIDSFTKGLYLVHLMHEGKIGTIEKLIVK